MLDRYQTPHSKQGFRRIPLRFPWVTCGIYSLIWLGLVAIQAIQDLEHLGQLFFSYSFWLLFTVLLPAVPALFIFLIGYPFFQDHRRKSLYRLLFWCYGIALLFTTALLYRALAAFFVD